MTGKLVALTLCAIFVLSIVTVRLKCRETLMKYEIAQIESFEELLLERCTYLKAEYFMKTGGISLLQKAVELRIALCLDTPFGEDIPLVMPMAAGAALE